MSDEAAFLKAIRENPRDDTVRLAYADWLDERDDPRAEYIRLRHQLAQLHSRFDALADQAESEWLTAVGGVPPGQTDFTLNSGRTIHLQELRQWGLYEGLLEGLPNREMNARRVESIVRTERDRSGQEPYLIRAVETPIKRHKNRPSPFGTPASLPGIVCVGRFTSYQPTKGSDEDGSELLVIWFQHEFALPVDQGVRQQIRAIDWDTHATNFGW
ncbi:Uncharacterized protein OS=Cystobacter violaceus Cb vi76 GN=Q664_31220 PE=4 SV=1 [Gemmataceae bacterium]|nr:Uncharacterized protein OS=Cystobacter violaceus Cb vi76 GN=Q664_31220 PE=4 SV=1 [Gemmataceae bacterium]VTT96402.1 Uncharacterized protein OS=Cystobacter violaceus Cb vi76 GN=Q664_31220 PE=4 SV=1 [Gemmataceae bacterium]